MKINYTINPLSDIQKEYNQYLLDNPGYNKPMDFWEDWDRPQKMSGFKKESFKFLIFDISDKNITLNREV